MIALAHISTLVSAIFVGGYKTPHIHYDNKAVLTCDAVAVVTIKISTTPFEPPLLTMITSPAFKSSVDAKKYSLSSIVPIASPSA
jgi:hypothetical protein